MRCWRQSQTTVCSVGSGVACSSYQEWSEEDSLIPPACSIRGRAAGPSLPVHRPRGRRREPGDGQDRHPEPLRADRKRARAGRDAADAQRGCVVLHCAGIPRPVRADGGPRRRGRRRPADRADPRRRERPVRPPVVYPAERSGLLIARRWPGLTAPGRLPRGARDRPPIVGRLAVDGNLALSTSPTTAPTSARWCRT